MNHPKDHHKCFARLACVKHAASVHPEPGSNSLKKFVQDQIFAWLNFIPFYLLWFCSLRTKFFWTFKDMSLFSYQGSWFVAVSAATSILYQVLFPLSTTFYLFWRFKSLNYLNCLSSSINFIGDMKYNTPMGRDCQLLFSIFFIFHWTITQSLDKSTLTDKKILHEICSTQHFSIVSFFSSLLLSLPVLLS